MIYGCLEWKFEINLYFNDSGAHVPQWRANAFALQIGGGRENRWDTVVMNGGVRDRWTISSTNHKFSRYRSDVVRWTLIRWSCGFIVVAQFRTWHWNTVHIHLCSIFTWDSESLHNSRDGCRDALCWARLSDLLADNWRWSSRNRIRLNLHTREQNLLIYLPIWSQLV